MRIVDDDADDWKKEPETKQEVVEEEEDQPVVAEFVDERPEEVKRMEEFRNSNKWRVIQGRFGSPNFSPSRRHQHSPSRVTRNDYQKNSPLRRDRNDSPDSAAKHWRKNKVNSSSDSASYSYSKKKYRSPSPSSAKNRHGSLPQKTRMHSPYSSPKKGTDKSVSYVEKASTSKRPNPSPPYSSTRHDSDSDLSPPRKMERTSTQNKQIKVRLRDSDMSPPRRAQPRGSDSDLSPPRHNQRKGSDLSPPRRANCKDLDVSPPRRRAESEKGSSSSQRTGPKMLSGGRAGLVSAEVLRQEKEEERKAQKDNKNIEKDSRNAETVFRDKSGKRRDLATERDQQLQKQAKQDKRDEMYAQWGKGLAQQEQQRQNLEDATREMAKPLARYIDDVDLDLMLREQEREGDPMAKFLKKKKEKEQGGTKALPRYNGPNPPPNRFNIWPGYRWDGVDRSNGFENKHFARISEKKAVQETAYKWSVEDM
uniref:BUD13 homolog n=1 Tax=Pyxicephalus adspersus TaxID=30357 RepID=A0AAV2ZWB0_PYXAD|nr:TPA: hypothetical protein GDO54_003635 [Pyxicephalus adspersus]